MELIEFLTWIGSSGGNAIIASWIFERIPQFQALESSAKQWIYFAAVLVLSLASYVVLTYVPKPVLDGLAPVFGMLYSTFVAVFAGTAFHKVDKK